GHMGNLADEEMALKTQRKIVMDYLVHQDAIHTERVQKEQRHQKLHTEFSINPYRKLQILPDKPMCRRPTEVIPEHADFIKAFHKAHEVPTKKYSVPLTESQEIGWVSTPLVSKSLSVYLGLKLQDIRVRYGQKACYCSWVA
uniref:Cilia and flagella associated protein 144 n=1 Tax=Amphilophus citrinellus TaxID=61819 RepID=A0A3Q0RVR2_AMPCI